jgi:hypothetical protein
MPENEGTDTSSHDAGTRKGEEIKEDDGKEAGRHDEGETGADRPAGSSTARDSTGINPEDENPIDPNSPKLPPA